MKKQIDFLRWGNYAAVLSSILFIASIGIFFKAPIHWGLDFTGGTVVEASYSQPADLDKVRTALHQAGFEDAVIKYFGTTKDVLVRMAPHNEFSNEQLTAKIHAGLNAAGQGDANLKSVSNVGAQVGSELASQGLMAILATFAAILIYVGLRFEWRLAAGAILALVHDTLITAAILILCGFEIDLNILAALLALIGYSINDTIVILDRIRESFRKYRTSNVREIINISINDTLSRTIMTSITVLLVSLVLYFLGGPSVQGFGFTMAFGVIIGTFSSIYVASNLAVWFGLSKEDMLPKQIDRDKIEAEDLL